MGEGRNGRQIAPMSPKKSRQHKAENEDVRMKKKSMKLIQFKVRWNGVGCHLKHMTTQAPSFVFGLPPLRSPSHKLSRKQGPFLHPYFAQPFVVLSPHLKIPFILSSAVILLSHSIIHFLPFVSFPTLHSPQSFQNFF